MRFTEQENLSLFEFSFIMNVSASILSLSDNYLSMATASNCSCSANVAPDQSHNQLLPVILTMHKFSCSMEEIKVRTNYYIKIIFMEQTKSVFHRTSVQYANSHRNRPLKLLGPSTRVVFRLSAVSFFSPHR